MATKLGKLLVLLNAFAAVAVLSWALSAYLTRQDSDQAVDRAGEKLTEKVKRLNAELNTAQSVFGPEFAQVSAAEVRLADVRQKIQARLQEAQTGLFFNIFDDQPQGRDPNDPTGLTRTRRILWGQLPAARQITGAGGTPLKGIEAMQKELQDEGAKIAALVTSIQEKVDRSNALSVEIQNQNARAARLKRIHESLVSETQYLEDQRVNWDVRITTLERRNGQLTDRLTDLGAPVRTDAAAVPPAVATVAAPTR